MSVEKLSIVGSISARISMADTLDIPGASFMRSNRSSMSFHPSKEPLNVSKECVLFFLEIPKNAVLYVRQGQGFSVFNQQIHKTASGHDEQIRYHRIDLNFDSKAYAHVSGITQQNVLLSNRVRSRYCLTLCSEMKLPFNRP